MRGISANHKLVKQYIMLLSKYSIIRSSEVVIFIRHDSRIHRPDLAVSAVSTC